MSLIVIMYHHELVVEDTLITLEIKKVLNWTYDERAQVFQQFGDSSRLNIFLACEQLLILLSSHKYKKELVEQMMFLCLLPPYQLSQMSLSL